MSQNNAPTLLVTGASGHLGRRVVELLLESHKGQIIATTRTPEKLADFAERGVIVRPADFDNPASLAEAFAGADRLLLISTDTLDGTDRRQRQHKAAIQAAENAGVNHIVYLSLVNPTDTPVLLAPDHAVTEAALAASNLSWTVLRENIYTEILLGALGPAVQMGRLFVAAADGKTAYITREDCARTAAAALASDFAGRRTLDITGPAALSQAEIAAIVSEISGTKVEYVPLPVEVVVQNLVGFGLPEPVAQVYASFDTAIAHGKFSGVTTTVQDLTGRPATSIAEFLKANQAAFLQSTPA